MAKQAKDTAFGIVLGASIGFIAGILLAPKSGKETREDIRRNALQFKQAAEEKLHEAQDELTTLLAKAEDTAKKMGSKVSAEAKQSIAQAKKARVQAKEVLRAVKSGESTDEDLDIAVKNAHAALASLRVFFHK